MNKKLLAQISAATLLLSVSVYSWAEACKPIAEVCMQMGYYKGGEDVGKGLVKDCLLPVTSGSKTLPNTNFSISQLQNCKLEVEQKMKTMQ